MDRESHDKIMRREENKIAAEWDNTFHMSDRQKQIYRIILNNPGIRARELCNILGCQRPSLSDRMNGMIDNGIIIVTTVDNHGAKSFKVDRRRKVIL